MLPKNILEEHYKEYANQPDSWVSNMKKVKKEIIENIFKNIKSTPKTNSIKVAVLGASDKRYIKIHKDLFTEITKKDIQMTTFDIDTKHLEGEEGIIYHDITKPFPQSNFDIIFSHALLKFIEPEKQAEVIRNSYNSLNKQGFTMHILHSPELKETKELRAWQYKVDINSIIEKLKKDNINCRKITFNIESSVDWLRETTVIIAEK